MEGRQIEATPPWGFSCCFEGAIVFFVFRIPVYLTLHLLIGFPLSPEHQRVIERCSG